MKKPREERHAWSPDSEFIYARNRIGKACPANQTTLRAFEEWLREERGLSTATVTIRIGTACTFVDEITDRAGAPCVRQAFETLTSTGVEDSFVQYGKDHGRGARRSMQASMRLFLKFAASSGWVGGELAEAVPSLPVFRLSGLPEGLRDKELSMVLSASWEGCECPLRNRAIILLLSTYGVRRSQVSALQFEDIDWFEGTIIFAAHKGGKEIHHDLTQAAAGSLADYLRNERPTSGCNYVFLRHRSPHVRLSPPEAGPVLVPPKPRRRTPVSCSRLRRNEHGTPSDGGPRLSACRTGRRSAEDVSSGARSGSGRSRPGQQGRKRACLPRREAAQAGLAGWRPDLSMRVGRS
jgi:integrase